MLKHIVMFRVKDSEHKAQDVQLLKETLEGLRGKVEELKKLEVGVNISTRPVAYDIVLYTEFDTEEDLQAYQVHPEHQKVVDVLLELKESLAVVDYWA